MTILLIPARKKPTSYIDLVVEFPEFFYTSDQDALGQMAWAEALREKETIPAQALQDINNMQIDHENNAFRPPTLVEITWCWIHQLKVMGGYHRRRNVLLQTKTTFQEGNFMLHLKTNEHLDVICPQDKTPPSHYEQITQLVSNLSCA